MNLGNQKNLHTYFRCVQRVSNMVMDQFILVPFCWHQHSWNLWMWIPPHPYGLWDCKNRHPVDSPNSAYVDNNFWEPHRYISKIHQKKSKYIKLKHINPKTRNSLKIRFDAKSQPLFQCEVPTRSAQWPNTRGWPQRRPRSPDSAVERGKWHQAWMRGIPWGYRAGTQ